MYVYQTPQAILNSISVHMYVNCKTKPELLESFSTKKISPIALCKHKTNYVTTPGGLVSLQKIRNNGKVF
jgi:hypothetical protein